MEQELPEKKLSPEKLFRLIALICLIGTGLSAIYVTSHVGSMTPGYIRAHDLASYFFTALWVFVFFYVQYRVVPRVTKRRLNDGLGYFQSLGVLALLLVGALQAIWPRSVTTDVPSAVLFWIALAGEGVFIVNVVRSYTSGEEVVPISPVAPAATKVPERVGDDSVKNFGWPKSPVKLFGTGASFFAAGGILSLIVNFPSFKIPVPMSGQLHFLPFGYLWFAAAAPFALFAMLYKFLMDAYGLELEESMNRIHFVVTIIAVFDLVRVFVAWEQTLVSKTAALFFGPQIQWLVVLFLFSAVVFAINAVKSYLRSTSRA